MTPDKGGAVLAVLHRLGQDHFRQGPEWHPRQGLPPDVWPDAVVFTPDAGKYAHYAAGFYRGRGVPVVFVSDEAGHETRGFASKSGAFVVFGPGHFAEWLATNPDYLRVAGSVA